MFQELPIDELLKRYRRASHAHIAPVVPDDFWLERYAS